MRDEMRYEDAYEEGIVPCDWLDKAVAEEIQDRFYEFLASRELGTPVSNLKL